MIWIQEMVKLFGILLGLSLLVSVGVFLVLVAIAIFDEISWRK